MDVRSLKEEEKRGIHPITCCYRSAKNGRDEIYPVREKSPNCLRLRIPILKRYALSGQWQIVEHNDLLVPK
jgi:hypothetical protein